MHQLAPVTIITLYDGGFDLTGWYVSRFTDVAFKRPLTANGSRPGAHLQSRYFKVHVTIF